MKTGFRFAGIHTSRRFFLPNGRVKVGFNELQEPEKSSPRDFKLLGIHCGRAAVFALDEPVQPRS